MAAKHCAILDAVLAGAADAAVSALVAHYTRMVGLIPRDGAVFAPGEG